MPLFAAVRNGDLEVTKRLLEQGADPLKPDKFEGTPLIGAAFGGNLEIVNILLELGVEVNG